VLSGINRLVAANGDWNNANKWNRPVGVAATIPKDNDVAVLDPTFTSDTGTTITIGNAGTNKLQGLLNDVTLNVGAGGALQVVGISGALNGGVINLSDQSTTANFSYSLDNQGRMNVTNKAS